MLLANTILLVLIFSPFDTWTYFALFRITENFPLDVNIFFLSLFFFLTYVSYKIKIIYIINYPYIYIEVTFYRFLAYRRLSESQFKHSLSRDADIFSKRDSASTSNPGTPNSLGSRSTPSRENVFEIGNNTLPRGKRV